MTELQSAIAAAYAADEAFESAVKRAGFKSRWDVGASQHPNVKPAYAAKITADRAMHAAFELSRKS